VGSAIITVTTAEGGYTASVAVTVQLSQVQQDALVFAEKLGENASAYGITVTLKETTTATANVAVPAGVILNVPAGATLTVPQGYTLSGAGTITVGGYVDAGDNNTFPGTVNLANESASRGLIAKPTDAASGWVYRFFDRTWSDRIAVPTCSTTAFPLSTTEAHCKKATAENGILRTYYNWPYVDAHKDDELCPNGWRVPTVADCKTIPSYNEEARTIIGSLWGWGGKITTADGVPGDTGGFTFIWTSEIAPDKEGKPAAYAFFTATDWGPHWDDKNDEPAIEYIDLGEEVRCVRD
jgi:hypothetical protein